MDKAENSGFEGCVKDVSKVESVVAIDGKLYYQRRRVINNKAYILYVRIRNE